MNYKCPYSVWPQKVKFTDLVLLSAQEIEKKYNVIKKQALSDLDFNSEHFEWDDSTLVMLMEDFIRSHDLEDELKRYLHRQHMQAKREFEDD